MRSDRRPSSVILVTAATALAALLVVLPARAAGSPNPTAGASKPAGKSHAGKGSAAIPPEALAAMPDDATGYCGDSTWTTSQTKQGACSGHGGVKAWLGPAPKDATGRCKDGTYTKAKKGAGGACSGHGGVKSWKDQPAPAAAPTPATSN